MEVIPNVPITIFWRVYDLLVSVVKLGRKGFNVPGASFPTYKNGPLPGRFLRIKGDRACQW